MKMFLLSSDEDTLTGLRLAGIRGALIESEEDFDFHCRNAEKDESIGILLVTRSLGEKYPRKLIEIKKSGRLLVSEVPDVYQPHTSGDSITRYIRDAVGVAGD